MKAHLMIRHLFAILFPLFTAVVSNNAVAAKTHAPAKQEKILRAIPVLINGQTVRRAQAVKNLNMPHLFEGQFSSRPLNSGPVSLEVSKALSTAGIPYTIKRAEQVIKTKPHLERKESQKVPQIAKSIVQRNTLPTKAEGTGDQKIASKRYTNIDSLAVAGSATQPDIRFYNWYLYPAHRLLVQKMATDTNLETINKYMQRAQMFSEVNLQHYIPNISPDTLRKAQGRVCSGKTLWLADKINVRTLQFIIGNFHPSSTLPHAWLRWHDGVRWWILDCVKSTQPIPENMIPSHFYVAYHMADWEKVHTLIKKAEPVVKIVKRHPMKGSAKGPRLAKY
jgi:hypothetical protein